MFILSAFFQSPPTVTIDFTKPGIAVSRELYGLMTEEINYSYDGGLYAELIRNRAFMDDAKGPSHWTTVDGSTITLEKSGPTEARPMALKFEKGVANDGYWGFPIKPNSTYQLSIWVKAEGKTSLKASLESADGATVYAKGELKDIEGGWKNVKTTFKTARNQAEMIAPRFVLRNTTSTPVSLAQVSLFPPTYKKVENGFRIDLMDRMAQMNPKFLRFPGGNYLEGNTLNDYFPWKTTLGPIEGRPGHRSPWGYRSTDGMGLAEFLRWCEDLRAKPVLAVYAGYALNGQYTKPGPDLVKWVDYALEEIEYLIGGPETKWGAARIKNGHPKPYDLEYVEVGNEDGFDKSGSYPERFNQFFDAIKAKYPKIKVIASTGGKDWLGAKFPITARPVDAVDEHYYSTAWEMMSMATKYDSYDRKGPKIFVGEWAAHTGKAPWEAGPNAGPTPDMTSAVADAAFMTGMERNSDIVVMQCYAPLFVNANPGGRQWSLNLIGYDALNTFGAPSYYGQVMFGQNVGDRTVPARLSNVPQVTEGDKALPGMFTSVTMDSKSKYVYLKLVNALAVPRSIMLDLKGAEVEPGGTLTMLSGQPADVNSLAEPKKVYPVKTTVLGLKAGYEQKMPAHSIAVLKMRLK